MEEVFEFVPSYKITKDLTFKEMFDLSDITSTSVLQKRIIKLGIGTKKTYTPEECNRILNERTDIKNWIIKGYYSIVEAAKEFKCSPSTMRNRLTEFKIPVLEQHINNKGYTWISRSNLDKLKQFLKGNKKFTNERFTTCSELAVKYSLPLYTVWLIAKRSMLPFVVDKSNQHLFMSEVGDKLEDLVVEHCRLESETKNTKISDLFKLHPLVKDKKFFNFYYFPDPIPRCFKDVIID